MNRQDWVCVWLFAGMMWMAFPEAGFGQAQEPPPLPYRPQFSDPNVEVEVAVAVARKALVKNGDDPAKYVIIKATWELSIVTFGADVAQQLLPLYGDRPFWFVSFRAKNYNKPGDYTHPHRTVLVYGEKEAAVQD